MREFGSEHPAIIMPDGYFESFGKLGREVTYLRSGREALMYAGLNASNSERKIILLPSYCCWSMRFPFIKAGWFVIYYPLNDDLTVNEKCLGKLLMVEKPQAVLTMNFFGSSSTEKAVRKIKTFDSNIKIIEDFSHCTFCLKDIYNNDVDYYVSSIRKSIGISDGAVVLSKWPTNHEFIQFDVTDFSDQRYLAQNAKLLYTYSKEENQKQMFLKSIRNCEKMIDNINSVCPISHRSMEMLKSVNGSLIAFARRQNMEHLWELLRGKVKMVPLLNRSFKGAPFSLPILVNNRDKIQEALAKRGVFTQVLWPIDVEAQLVCKVARKMNNMMLSVPIDQRFSWDDIEDMACIIIDVCKELKG